MKKNKILILFMCISLISYAQTSFDGKWNFSDMTTPVVSFSLMITQNGSTITGWHCSVMFDGNFIDCFEQE
jgi:hypothetical protein